MTNAPRFGCEDFIEQLHEEARMVYGDLDLRVEAYRSSLTSIVQKHFGESYQDEKAMDFLRKTRTTDLYLAVACAEKIEVAWKQFIESYGSFVYQLAKFFCSNAAAADELASNVMADLFMPGRSNLPRIASNDGRISLEGWLRAIVLHRASDERKLKWNSVERLDDQPDIAGTGGIARIEASARASRTFDSVLFVCPAVEQKSNDVSRDGAFPILRPCSE